MIISSNAHFDPTPDAFRLTGNLSRLGHQVAFGSTDILGYMSSAEMAELGQRFIELSAQAAEREQAALEVA